MKGESKSQAHLTVPEYQIPFGYPSPGDYCSLPPENRASFESLVIIPDEGHSSGPDENVTDDIVLGSDRDHPIDMRGSGVQIFFCVLTTLLMIFI